MADQEAAEVAAMPQEEEDNQQRHQHLGQAFVNIIGLTAGQSARMTNNGIDVIEDFTVIDEDTMLEIFPTTGNNALGAMQKMRLKALHRWTMQKAQELDDIQEMDVREFTADVCHKI